VSHAIVGVLLVLGPLRLSVARTKPRSQMRITVLNARVYEGNQRATGADVEKIAIIAKTEDLGGLQEIDNVTEMSSV